MSVAGRVAGTTLSPALARVADHLLDDPESVAFGTVASVAAAVGASTPTVVRCATALGYAGFADLRDAVRAELSDRLTTAAGRVQQVRAADHGPSALLDDVLAIERDNVERTIASLRAASVEAVLDLLADDGRIVHVVASAQTRGVAGYLADHLGIIRDGVHLLDGPELAQMSRLAALRPGDVLLSLDLQRHERTTVRVQRWAVDHGAVPVVVTDRLPCRLATAGGVVLTFACGTGGPFESMVGLHVIVQTLLQGLTQRRRTEVAGRLRRLERAWTSAEVFER